MISNYIDDCNAWGDLTSPLDSPLNGTNAMDYGDQFDRVVGTLMPGQSKIIIGVPDNEGVGGRLNEHSLWETPMTGYGTLGAGERTTHPTHCPETGPTMTDYKWSQAAIAYADFPEHNPHKPRIIHTHHEDVVHRIGVEEAGVMAAIRDQANIHHLEYSPAEWRYQTHETANESQQHGALGKFIKTLVSYITPTRDQAKHIDHPKTSTSCHPVMMAIDLEGTTPQELAASLYTHPTRAIEFFIRDNPVEGLRLMTMLQEIGESLDPPTPDQLKVLGLVIRKSLQVMEFEKAYDPRMVEFAQPGEPLYLDTKALRRKIGDIQRILCDPCLKHALPDEVNYQKLIFPLAIRMCNRKITPSIMNIIPEIDGMIDLSRVIDSIPDANRNSKNDLHDIEAEVMDILSHESGCTLASIAEPAVIDAMILSRDLPDNLDPIVYPAGAANHETREMTAGLGEPIDRPTTQSMATYYRAHYDPRDLQRQVNRGKQVIGYERSKTTHIAPDRSIQMRGGLTRYS